MRILIIEDDQDHIELEREICLSAFGSETRIYHDSDLGTGLESLVSNTYDICLCDLSFPMSSAKETVQQLQKLKGIPHAPVIVLTSVPGESNAQDLLHHGIQDYILKSELSTYYLRRVVTFAIDRQKYQLLLEERNRDQQAFCSSLSHDFRDKIGNIKQTSVLLQKSLKKDIQLNNRQAEWFKYIEDGSSHMLELVEGLTTYLRVDQSTADFEEINLLALMEQMCKSLVLEHRLEATDISFECNNTTTIFGDPTQIYLMLQNLVKNALKFSQPNPGAHILIEDLAEDGRVTIHVTDKGMGMTEPQLEKIFEPFHRAHEGVEGTGLGLSIVNRVVQRHAGCIEIQSEPKKGSTFTVHLPGDLKSDRVPKVG